MKFDKDNLNELEEEESRLRDTKRKAAENATSRRMLNAEVAHLERQGRNARFGARRKQHRRDSQAADAREKALYDAGMGWD